MLVSQGHMGGVRTRGAAGDPQVTPPRESTPPCTPRTPPTQSPRMHTHSTHTGPAVSLTPVGTGRVSCSPCAQVEAVQTVPHPSDQGSASRPVTAICVFIRSVRKLFLAVTEGRVASSVLDGPTQRNGCWRQALCPCHSPRCLSSGGVRGAQRSPCWPVTAATWAQKALAGCGASRGGRRSNPVLSVSLPLHLPCSTVRPESLLGPKKTRVPGSVNSSAVNW